MTPRSASREASSPARGSDRFLVIDDSADDITEILCVICEHSQPNSFMPMEAAHD
jgi:hypothetical protein